jgi:hypothetical protein
VFLFVLIILLALICGEQTIFFLNFVDKSRDSVPLSNCDVCRMERESSAYENIKLITPERDSASKLANRLKHVGRTTVEKKISPSFPVVGICSAPNSLGS